ncbi:DUF4410 domain-containing protein [Thermodesulfobacteriota bacterium]
MSKREIRIGLYAIMLLALVALGGCGAYGKTMVVKEVENKKVKVTTYEIAEGKHAVEVPAEYKKLFVEILTDNLEDDGLKKGKDLKIEYKFTEYDEGSGGLRFLLGGAGGMGEGKMVINVRFLDASGKALAEISAKGIVDTDKDFEPAIEFAAGEVSEYIEDNFNQE